MRYIIISPPAEEPISVAEAKLHARVTSGTAEDTYIAALITAARLRAEHELGRTLVTTTLRAVADGFPDACSVLALPRPPAASIVHVKYLDLGGIQQTLAASAYTLDNITEPAQLLPAYGTTWPATLDAANAVEVQYTAGYGGAAAVPAPIRHWISVLVTQMYERRIPPEGAQNTRTFVDALLDPYRIYAL